MAKSHRGKTEPQQLVAERNGRCFFISRIGDEGSIERREVDGLFKSVIEPVVEALDLKADVAHRMADGGSITKQVIERLLQDDLVIANLTGLNPNVMYELAVRHAIRKPIVTIAVKGTKLPFDVYDVRVLFFTDDMLGADELKTVLPDFIKVAMERESADNPIYRATSLLSVMQSVETTTAEKTVIEMLQEIQTGLGALQVKQGGHKGSGQLKKVVFNVLDASSQQFDDLRFRLSGAFPNKYPIMCDYDEKSLTGEIEVHDVVTVDAVRMREFMMSAAKRVGEKIQVHFRVALMR